MAHVPGPWSLINDSIWARDSDLCVMWAHAEAKCGREGDDFYGCTPPRPKVVVRWKSPEDLALALAAPDLLAALKAILACPEIADAAPEDVDDETRDAERTARAAIRRAEGKDAP